MAREQADPAEIEALINELETKLSRLRAIYEQYFMGIERMPPRTLRKDVVRLIHKMEALYIRNTATKFKVRSLVQRFNSYKAYWSRVERQIEEGTYVRDIRRAERNRERRRSRNDRSQAASEDPNIRDDGVVEIDFDDVVDLRELEVELEALDAGGAFDKKNEPQPAARSASPPTDERKRQKLAEIAGALGLQGDAVPATQSKPAAQERPKPSREAPASVGARRDKLAEIKRRMEARGGTSSTSTSAASGGGRGGDDDARRVYNQLIEAKRRCNEPTDNLKYESVAKSMKKQRDQLKQSRGSDVEFKVVIKDGRAFIKPETK